MLTVGSYFYIQRGASLKWIETRDQNRAQDYVSDMPWAAISISSGHNYVKLKENNRVSNLQISFQDCRNSVNILRGFSFGGLFSQKNARSILSFVDNCWDKVDSFLIQCEDGKSKSSAVSAAIIHLKYGQKAAAPYFEDNDVNLLIYRTILKERCIF